MKHPLLSSSHNDIITQTLDDKYFVFFRIQTRIVWSKKSCVVISRSLLVIRLFSTKTGTSDNNTKFNQLSIKWNMLFSSDILDQFVKRDLFSMKEVVICLFPTFFPWRLVFVPGEIIIGLATINKTAFYHLIFLNGEI